VRARSAELKLPVAEAGSLMKERDIHIHFPAGAVPKDGPSAGVTLVTALVSLFAKRSVRADTAMTGEMTLRGLVLPVGGIKDKILAAHRCGIRRVILPERNRKDLQEVPAAILTNMEVTAHPHLSQVLQLSCNMNLPSTHLMQKVFFLSLEVLQTWLCTISSRIYFGDVVVFRL
jgi:ATP-dependent Lon protease